jgi:hypothetical protein
MLEVIPIKVDRSLIEWYRERNKIDMNPSYQRRGDLWPTKNKQLLINSILNRYDIPKIYLADFTYIDTPLKEKKKPYAVIDGKQRLTIFFAFFDDKLHLDNTPVYNDSQELNLAGLKYSDLKREYPSLAQRFDEFVPTIMSVISDKLEEVQELFIRLNLNVSISGAERRNAMPGPLPQLIRDLSVHELFREYASFPINRGQDLNIAAKLLLMEDREGFANTKKNDLDQFVLSKIDEPISNLKRFYDNAFLTLNKMTKVFNKKDKLLQKSTQITLYYWLAKKYADQYDVEIRNFLNMFERDRGKVRSQARNRARGKDVDISDYDLLQYNNFLRSPDDKTKQELMYSELDNRLKNYLNTTLHKLFK